MAYPFDMAFNLDAAGQAQGLYGNYQINPDMIRSIQQQRMNSLIAPMQTADNGNLLQQGLANNGAALGMIQGGGGAEMPQVSKGFLGRKFDALKDTIKEKAASSVTGGATNKLKNWSPFGDPNQTQPAPNSGAYM